MSPKIANLIAIETGILVGLMSWLTFSHLRSSEPRAEAGMQGNMVAPVRGVAPITPGAPAFEASNKRPSTAEYSAEREQARLMAERSASLQSYYRAIARESGTTSALENGSADSSTYAEVNPEPAALADEYVAPAPTVFYYAPAAVQNVVFANPHRFRNRCRSTPHRNCAPPMITHQCPDRRNSPPSDSRVVSVPNVSTPSPPAEGFKPRDPVRQTGVTGGPQKRVALPGSPGAARRSLSVP